jgi:hypothetical protein
MIIEMPAAVLVCATSLTPPVEAGTAGKEPHKGVT